MACIISSLTKRAEPESNRNNIRAAEEGGWRKKEETSQSRRSEDTEYGPSAAASEEGADRGEPWNGAEMNTQRRVGGHGEGSSTGNGVRTEVHRF